MSLLLGCFEYGTRAFSTDGEFRRTLMAAGFEVLKTEGIVVPTPFIFGTSRLSRLLMAVNKFRV
jgi:hypothetical protein